MQVRPRAARPARRGCGGCWWRHGVGVFGRGPARPARRQKPAARVAVLLLVPHVDRDLTRDRAVAADRRSAVAGDDGAHGVYFARHRHSHFLRVLLVRT